MANITPKANGTYLVRISCGLDSAGKQIVRSKTFKPSKPNLSTTVFRSMLSLAYQLEYTENNVGASRRIVFSKDEPTEIEVYSEKEMADILEALKTV